MDNENTPPRGSRPVLWGHASERQRASMKDDTSPLQMLLEGELSQDDRRSVEELRGHIDDPYDMVFRLAMTANMRRDRHRTEEADSQRKMQAQIDSLIHSRGLVYKIAVPILVLALGSLGAGIKIVASSSEHIGETNATINRLVKDVDILFQNRRSP